MKTKLTLTVEQEATEKAKVFAASHHVSLSKMVEVYFNSLKTEDNDTTELEIRNPLVRSLAGSLKGLDENPDMAKQEYLERKYLHD